MNESIPSRVRVARWTLAALGACLVALLPLACSDSDNEGAKDQVQIDVTPPDTEVPVTPTPPETPETPATPPPALSTDSHIVFGMQASNAAEIRHGQLAVAKNPHPDVIQFADRMIFEHTAANQRLDAIVATLLLQPAESDVSAALQKSFDTAYETLQAAPGFDLAYMESQVALLTEILNAMDTQFIPKARDQRLRLELMNQRDEVANHLDVAQAIIRQLTGTGPSPDAGTGEPGADAATP